MKTLKPTLAVSLATLALALSAGVAPAAAGGYKG